MLTDGQPSDASCTVAPSVCCSNTGTYRQWCGGLSTNGKSKENARSLFYSPHGPVCWDDECRSASNGFFAGTRFFDCRVEHIMSIDRGCQKSPPL